MTKCLEGRGTFFNERQRNPYKKQKRRLFTETSENEKKNGIEKEGAEEKIQNFRHARYPVIALITVVSAPAWTHFAVRFDAYEWCSTRRSRCARVPQTPRRHGRGKTSRGDRRWEHRRPRALPDVLVRGPRGL